jgi:membrane-associated protease RseP (regulator of RpoE activity)
MPAEQKQSQPIDDQLITSLVREVFEIQSMTLGAKKQGYHVLYTGQLKDDDSEAAYERLSEALAPMGLMPLFRQGEGEQRIILVDQLPQASTGAVWVNMVLFIFTIVSVMFTGAQFADTTLTSPFSLSLMDFLRYLLKGWPFALSMLGILTAHELGHYFVGRARGANVTLPYFIPFPLSPFGTMGAFISMKSIPKNRKALLDVGLAGPLSGLVVAIPVLFIGLALSDLGPIVDALPEGYVHFIEGNSLFYLFAKFVTFGKLLPQPASYGDLSPFLYWLRYFFTGTPTPLGGLDVQIHPVAWAGWAGLFVTAINLIPAGQLDGGHILYVLFGRKKAKKTLPFILVILGVLGFFWSGWWFWAGLILFFGRRYAEPLDQITPIDKKRKILAMIALVIFLLIFIPVPLVVIQ